MYLHQALVCSSANSNKAEPKLAKLKDDDGRLPIHWAASSNQLEIARALVQTKGFDPDVQVPMTIPLTMTLD
jgi:ankyrin repeat protein